MDAFNSVIFVTDSRRLGAATIAERAGALIELARRAFTAGVDAVQIREPDFDGRLLFDTTRAIAALGPTIVTARADIAVAAGASGVHLKSDGPDPARVRAILPRHMTLSRAVHTVEEAARWGREAGLDWIVAGTVFETASKPGHAALGEEGLRAIVRESRLPVVGIGGITAGTAARARGAGAAGVAAIGPFLGSLSAEYVDSLRDRSLE
jgi:thiamine-phosphate diphosphorylase